jgi:hypothetical protein
MNQLEFISLVKQPENVDAGHVADLKQIVELYPGFVQARILYQKVLKLSNSIHFEANLKLTSIYCSNRRWLYYYIYPEKKLSSEHYRREHSGKSSGDYFDMIDTLERQGGDTKQSLKVLAERLKSARAQVNTEYKAPLIQKNASLSTIEVKVETNQLTSDQNLSLNSLVNEIEISELNAKKLIKDRKYSDAIEILKKLNLNNPKKSVYFADQIRFLEKVISNSKK